jgi:ATP-dependent Zn protease
MDNTTAWVNMLISWAPFIILIGFWVFFMKKGFGGKQGKYIERSMAFMDRQEQLLERIAVALEQRNKAGQ